MRICAIIPAYNEVRTIGEVVRVTSRVPEIGEVIVISDGSTDGTAELARQYGAKVIELEKNVGKGGAMKVGLDHCSADIVLFMDADLIGLNENHVKKLLRPVIDGEVDMTIGVFKGGRFSTDMAQKVSPFLSGQRAVRKSILDRMNNMEVTKFGVEVALTSYVKKNNIPYKKVMLEQMSHVMKEEKLGWKKGVQARIKMYWEIMKGIHIARSE